MSNTKLSNLESKVRVASSKLRLAYVSSKAEVREDAIELYNQKINEITTFADRLSRR